MKAEKIVDAIGEVREEYIRDAEVSQKRKRPFWPVLAATAACLAVIIGAFAWSGGRKHECRKAELPGFPDNVKVYTLDRVPEVMMHTEKELIYLTEEEIFTRWNTAIFRGTVTEIQNIEIDMNGESFYRAVLTVDVSKVLRGDLLPGDTARILIDTPIDTNVWVEDNDIIEQVRVGTEGVFMPVIYTEDSILGANGAELDLRDIAPYGLPDGVRYAFLMTRNGLVFLRDDPYERIAGAQTLEEIEAYIAEMLEKTP